MACNECCNCNICTKIVRSNQKGIFCNICLSWVHAKCARLSDDEFTCLSTTNDPWFCIVCLQNIIPFNNIANDVEFILNTTGSIALHHEESLIFNPFSYDDNKFLLNYKDLSRH